MDLLCASTMQNVPGQEWPGVAFVPLDLLLMCTRAFQVASRLEDGKMRSLSEWPQHCPADLRLQVRLGAPPPYASAPCTSAAETVLRCAVASAVGARNRRRSCCT
jgi:hypothetical protein